MLDAYYSEPPLYFGRPVTQFEQELAAALQTIFTAGVHDLEGIVAALKKSSVRPPDGDDWTVVGFQTVLKKLAW